MARYKIQSPTDEIHKEVAGLIKRFDPQALENGRRRYVTVVDPPPELTAEIQRMGARLVPDYPYDPD
jgi:hypothetical protein